MASAREEPRPSERGRPRPQRWRHLASRWGAPLAVVAAPVVLLGGVHPAVQVGLTLVYALGAAGAVVSSRRATIVWHPLLLVTLGLALASLLQLVPLPASLLATLSPTSSAAYAGLDAAFAAERAAAPLSLAPTSSTLAAARWLAVTLALFWLLQPAARSGQARSAVVRVLLGTAAAALVLAVLQGWLGLDALYGLFVPEHANARPGFGGPFVSGNHLSHFLLVAGCVALLVLSDSRSGRERVLLGGLLLGVALAMVVNASRGALLGLGVGAGLALAWRRRTPGTPLVWSSVLPALGLVIVLAALWVTLAGGASTWLSSNTLGAKLALHGAGWHLALEAPATGLGADAFGAVQTALAPLAVPLPHHASYVENDFLQLLLDFGFVVPLVLLGLALWSRRWSEALTPRRPRQLAVLGVPYAVAAWFGFSTPVLGVLLPGLAVLLVRAGRLRRAQLPRKARPLLAASVVLLGLTAVGGALATPGGGPADTREALWKEARERPLDARHVWAVTLTGWQRGLLTSAEVRTLAELVETRAGNDDAVLDSLSAFWFGLDEPERGWEVALTAWDANPERVGQLVGWVQRSPDSETVTWVCARRPDRCDALLAELARADRHADLLMVALAVEAAAPARGLYWSVLGATRLGEPLLAEAFAERLAALSVDSAEECYRRGEALMVVGRRERALANVAPCLEQFPGDPALLLAYPRWALALPADDSRAERALAYLSEANRHLGAERHWRRDYWWLLTLHQARSGECRAAQLSLTSAAALGSRRERLPDWVSATCPELR